MAIAIVSGLVAKGTNPDEITIVDPSAEQRARIQTKLGVKVSDAAGAACKNAEIIVLAVKPQIVPMVAQEVIAATPLGQKLVISIAAGVTLTTLESLFGQAAIARAMPNTPAVQGLGATGLYANAHTSGHQLGQATKIIEAFGICVPVEREDQLDAVTAVSGSGPAYVFFLIEEMINTGTKLGLSHQVASRLTLQTAFGAASMAAQGPATPDELRRQVTSPNGTTHAAITSLQDNGFGQILQEAMTACRDRAVELGHY